MGKIRVSSSSPASSKAEKCDDALASLYGKVGISAVAAALAVRSSGHNVKAQDDRARKAAAKR